MKNYLQRGENLTIAAPYNVKSGDGALVGGSIFGVCAEDAQSGVLVDLVTLGVFQLAKVAANVVAVGASIYWDDAAKLVTTTATGNTKIGVAVSAAVSGAPVVNVRLNGAFG